MAPVTRAVLRYLGASVVRLNTSGLLTGASVNRGTVPLHRTPLHNPRPGSCWLHSWCVPRYVQFQAPDFSPLLLQSTTHLYRPQKPLLSFLSACSRSIQARSLGFQDNERVTGIFSSYTSRPSNRWQYE